MSDAIRCPARAQTIATSSPRDAYISAKLPSHPAAADEIAQKSALARVARPRTRTTTPTMKVMSAVTAVAIASAFSV